MNKIASLCSMWVLLMFISVVPVEAALSSCAASVDPIEAYPGEQSLGFVMTITNTDSEDINWFRTTTPHADIVPLGAGLRGWNIVTVGNATTFKQNIISPGNSVAPFVNANIPVGLDGFSGNWTAEVSSDTEGAGAISCTGSLGLTVSYEAPDYTAPTFSDVTVSGISSSSVVISWTTNESANSEVQYDVSSEADPYSFSHDDATLKTSHSLTLTTSIAPLTTYYYIICGTDASSNQSCTNENSITTTEYVEPSAEVITQTVTVQATALPAQTKTIIIRDTTAPGVAISTEIDGAYERAPTIRGVAQDSKGVFRVDYSTDGGRNWLPVDEVSDNEAAKVSFEFTPLGLLDGNYEVKVRAIDTSNNAGFSKTKTLIIDRLPPRVGPTLLTIGPQPLQPTQAGLIYGLRGVSQKIILSSVGGATSIDLVAEKMGGLRSEIYDPIKVLGISQQMYSLSKNIETGLWYGAINFGQPGLYKLVAKAVDGADNKTERELQSVYVLPNGRVFSESKVVAGAKMTVYVNNPNTNRYVIWDGEAFLQQNPQESSPEGEYGLMLPPGKYYIEVSLRGHKLVRTPIFNLGDHTPINTDFPLEKLTTLKLFGKEFYLPTWKKTVVPVSIELPSELSVEQNNSLVGEELPFFILRHGDKPLYASDLVGKPTVISFLTTWSPLVSEQMRALDELKNNSGVRTVGIFLQETSSKVRLFMKRGGYETEVWADEDGELVESYSIHTTPTHIVLDSKGIVRDVVVGFLSSKELMDRLY